MAHSESELHEPQIFEILSTL
ncbi:uncharacterized protein G2W53_036554 [Senna tora]|uniref:Uncharacterized protein n=1 Tax=Senna tora TaxID=362788 RepID=A0A834W8U9_9FABA|nr:uncharacterized protein G2W53_036554 [Senna tora]